VLVLLLKITLAFNSFALGIPVLGPCLDEDVWVYIKHDRFFYKPSTTMVVVHVPKHSLQGDLQNCPAEDTKVLGQGRAGFNFKQFSGMHIVTLKKGKLNDSKDYTTKPPKKIEVPANNIDTWHVGIIRDY